MKDRKQGKMKAWIEIILGRTHFNINYKPDILKHKAVNMDDMQLWKEALILT